MDYYNYVSTYIIITRNLNKTQASIISYYVFLLHLLELLYKRNTVGQYTHNDCDKHFNMQDKKMCQTHKQK